MADRRFNQFVKSLIPGDPVMLAGTFQVGGATGAIVNTATGSVAQATSSQVGAGYGLSILDAGSLRLPHGVSSITRTGVGNYIISFGTPNIYPNGVLSPDTYRAVEKVNYDIVVPTGSIAGATYACLQGVEVLVPATQPSVATPSGVSIGITNANGQGYIQTVAVQWVSTSSTGSPTGTTSASAVELPTGAVWRFEALLKNSSVP